MVISKSAAPADFPFDLRYELRMTLQPSGILSRKESKDEMGGSSIRNVGSAPFANNRPTVPALDA